MNESKRIELFLRAEVKLLRDEIYQLRKERISIIYRIKSKFQGFRKQKISELTQEHLGIINDTTIIVPVYGQINLFGDLLKDLQKVTEIWNGVKIIIVDDKYDETSSNKLHELCKDVTNLEIIKNDSNQGYLKSVNQGFKHVKSKYVILLNSDVRIPDDWLPRMVKPFLDDSVALSTCLATQSGSNLTLDFINETNWREVDRLISGLESRNFEDACTAIGYCMAIRVHALGGQEIYNEEFSPAYGEDSDLHYRMKLNAWRSVVVGNLLIRHEGGASYGDSDETNRIRSKSMNLFLDKWGDKFVIDEKLFMQNNPIDRIKNFLAHEVRKPSIYDIIFVSPSNNSEIGGINVLIELANKLADSGFRVGFICLNYDPIHAIQNFTILQKESIKYISETKIVISSGLEVYKVIKELNHSLKFKFINIIQGPEYLMDNKFFEEEIFEIIYKESMFNIVVSPFLLANMGHFEIPNLKLITFGPDSRIFYDDFKVRENKMLISCRKEKSKGTELAISLIPILKKHGWEILGFGDLDNDIQISLFDEFYGRISKKQLSDLMRKCRVSLDFSTYEGLGLSPIESSMCGCIPVISNRGGNQSLEGLVRTDTLWVTTSTVVDISEILRSISKASEMSTIEVRKSNEENLLKLDFQKGFQQLLTLIESIVD
jgi:GT2 family glycosyltransferase